MIALSGSKLADTLAQATTTPLPGQLGNGTVLIAGLTMPLLFTSDGQVNAMIPFGLTPNSTQQVLALRGTSISVPQPVTIAEVAPGIFTTDGKHEIIVDAVTNKILAPGNPTKVGDYIVIYCTGLGEVIPAQKAGDAASSTVLPGAVTTVTAAGQVSAAAFIAVK